MAAGLTREGGSGKRRRVAREREFDKFELSNGQHVLRRNLSCIRGAESFRPQSLCRRLKFDHRLRGVPHALKMGLELSGGSCIMEHDQIVVLSSLATRIESRRSGEGGQPQG